MLKIEDVKNFDLKSTITCGQIFRYIEEDDNSFTVILFDRVVNIKQNDKTLYVEASNYDNLKDILFKFLDLYNDYERINKELLKNDMKIKELIKDSTGFKIINSYPLETIISYVISQNNRVPNIQKSLNMICEKYGNKVIFNNKEYFLFPTIEKLKNISEEEFKKFKTGFRASYLKGVIETISNDDKYLESFNDMDTKSSLEILMKEKGIGLKVASCILLFGYHKFDVFPIDTWVKKYMKDTYDIDGINNIAKFAKDKYGVYSAVAVQYMYNSKRNIDKK